MLNLIMFASECAQLASRIILPTKPVAIDPGRRSQSLYELYVGKGSQLTMMI